MNWRRIRIAIAIVLAVAPFARAKQVRIDPVSGTLIIDGEKVFPIGFTMGPPIDACSPSGENALAELHQAGASFIRSGPQQQRTWNAAEIARETALMDAADRAGLLCMPWLKELASIETDAKAERLKSLVETFKSHPAMGVWKGDDEPEWGKHDPKPLERARQIIHDVDPDHPVWIVQAPRGSVESLRRYNETFDIGGVDVYPIGYPPGLHSLLPNKDISVVGDHLKILRDAIGGKPAWMTLQIAWSGVIKEGKTLRMPTFSEERFMIYQSVALGARGLVFFGGNLEKPLPERDKPLSWNWTFFDKVLRPLLQEIGPAGPLQQALVTPESTLKITAPDVEFCVREVDRDLFIIATYRLHETKQVSFTGLPADVANDIEVLFESPRVVETTKADSDAVRFTDWFAPFDVHVYRLKRPVTQ